MSSTEILSSFRADPVRHDCGGSAQIARQRLQAALTFDRRALAAAQPPAPPGDQPPARPADLCRGPAQGASAGDTPLLHLLLSEALAAPGGR